MPPFDSVHIEEHHQTTVGFGRLLGYFLRFFRPRRTVIAATLVLAVCATAAELTLPYLMRTGIDRYIVPTAMGVDMARLRQHPDLMAEFEADLIRVDGTDAVFLGSAALRRTGSARVQQLQALGVCAAERYYIAAPSTGAAEVAQAHPDFFVTDGRVAVIAQADMARLSSAELLQLRRADVSGLARLSAMFLAVLLTGFVLNAAQIFWVEHASQHIMHDVRQTVFQHLISRQLRFFTASPVGRLVTRATNDVQNLHEMFNALFAGMLKDLLMIVGILAVLLTLDVRLGLACCAVLPVVLLATVLFSTFSRRAFREVRIKIAAINAMIQESIAGLAVLKVFCREHEHDRDFQRLNYENYQANMRQTTVFALFSPVIDLTQLCVMGIIVWYGGMRTLDGAMSLGTLVIFLYYMRMFFRPIQDIAEKYNIIQSAFASLERLYLLLEDSGSGEQYAGESLPAVTGGAVSFRNVWFAYNEDEPVLRDVSFDAAPGQTLAIVGVTGSGKTTLINLLERFYEPQQGSIFLDGVDIRRLDVSQLRRSMGLVLQDVGMFSGSIRENIVLGNPGISEQQLQQALSISNLAKVVARLPGGIDEPLMDGARMLSAGERQLLAFARAVAADPPVLVLDEATANIDPLTEDLIQTALKNITTRRTSIIIAHRLSTIRHADKIIVLHRGAVCEQGTHAELMALQGMYYRMSQLQYLAGS
ncbi:MAG: ABC transporter ATP-binding protein [Deltaproteobacteria bacterium]|nr:ABC transporter ATP-binding protein [Deltaproteobacteria bacterium]